MYKELIEDLRVIAKGETDEIFSEAADAIEDLSAERNANYADSWKMAFEIERDAHRWIPVTERLPEDRKMVLAAVDGVVCVAFYGNYMWEEVGTYSILYPTHWMPLPQPPKGE